MVLLNLSTPTKVEVSCTTSWCFLYQRTQRSKARLRLLIALNAGLKGQAWKTIGVKDKPLLERRNRKSSIISYFHYLRFSCRNDVLSNHEARELRSSNFSSLCIILVNIRMLIVPRGNSRQASESCNRRVICRDDFQNLSGTDTPWSAKPFNTPAANSSPVTTAAFVACRWSQAFCRTIVILYFYLQRSILTIRMSCFFHKLPCNRSNEPCHWYHRRVVHSQKANLFRFLRSCKAHQSLLVCSRYLHPGSWCSATYSTSKNNRCPWTRKFRTNLFSQVIAHKDNPIDLFEKECCNPLKLPFHWSSSLFARTMLYLYISAMSTP